MAFRLSANAVPVMKVRLTISTEIAAKIQKRLYAGEGCAKPDKETLMKINCAPFGQSPWFWPRQKVVEASGGGKGPRARENTQDQEPFPSTPLLDGRNTFRTDDPTMEIAD